MHKYLYVIGLASVIISCGSQKSVTPQSSNPKPTPKTTVVPAKKPITPPQKPAVKTQGQNDFFRENIADATKNDNTISYGSIVSANPKGYKVVKTYFPSVAQNFRQKYIILHYTALDNEKSIRVLTQEAVSAHYLVNDLDDNEIYQLVDENKRAYHAGISAWRNDKMLNDTSIGIEIVNQGYVTDSTGLKVFPEFNDAQVEKIAGLVKDIATRYMIPATNILAHSDIAPTRKQDPGPKFPWKKLYDEYQIGMWYDDAARQNIMQIEVLNDPYFATNLGSNQFIFKYQTALRTLGYGIEPSGILDADTKKTIESFQYHFRPEKYDGVMDGESWSILQALNQKYPSK